VCLAPDVFNRDPLNVVRLMMVLAAIFQAFFAAVLWTSGMPLVRLILASCQAMQANANDGAHGFHMQQLKNSASELQATVIGQVITASVNVAIYIPIVLTSALESPWFFLGQACRPRRAFLAPDAHSLACPRHALTRGPH